MSYTKTWITECIVHINDNVSIPSQGRIELKANIVRVIASGREMKCRLGMFISMIKNSKALGEHLCLIDRETGAEVHYTYGHPDADDGTASINVGNVKTGVSITADASAFDRWLKNYLKRRGINNGKQTSKNGTGHK